MIPNPIKPISLTLKPSGRSLNDVCTDLQRKPSKTLDLGDPGFIRKPI